MPADPARLPCVKLPVWCASAGRGVHLGAAPISDHPPVAPRPKCFLRCQSFRPARIALLPSCPRVEAMAANNKITMATSAVSGMRLVPLTSPAYEDKAWNPLRLDELPLKPAGRGQPVMHIFDVVENVDPGLICEGLTPMFMNSDYGALPAPLSPGATIPDEYTMDIVGIKADPAVDKVTVIKHFASVGGRLSRAVATSLCVGQPMILDTAAVHAKIGLKVMEYIFREAGCSCGMLPPHSGMRTRSFQ